MSFRTGLLSALFALSATVAAHAEIVQIDMPNSTERIAVTIPDGWKNAYSKKTDAGAIYEYVANGQSVSDWDEMITITVAPLSAVKEDRLNEKIAELSIRLFSANFCKSLFGQAGLMPDTRNGFPIAQYEAACFIKPEAKKLPNVLVKDFELLNGLVIVGKSGYFQVQRAWHTDDFAEKDEKTGMRKNGLDTLKAIGDGAAKTSTYVYTSTMPCDTADSAKPCGPPPLAKP